MALHRGVSPEKLPCLMETLVGKKRDGSWSWFPVVTFALNLLSIALGVLALAKPEALQDSWTAFLVKTHPVPIVWMMVVGGLVVAAWVVGHWEVPALKNRVSRLVSGLDGERERATSSELEVGRLTNELKKLSASNNETLRLRTRIRGLLAVEALSSSDLLYKLRKGPSSKSPPTEPQLQEVLGIMVEGGEVKKHSSRTGYYTLNET